MAGWTALTVSVWINTSSKAAGMRVVSKDRIGEPGNFMLWHDRKMAWTMQAWDEGAKAWRVASWRSDSLSDRRWHCLVGVVDSETAKVLLYVDGDLKAQAPWTAKSLDDSDRADLVIGANSGEERFGHTFQGLIHDVHLYPRALGPEQARAIFVGRGTRLTGVHRR